MIKSAFSVLGWLALLASAPATILLNEIHIQTGASNDLNYEFIEFRSSTDGVESCDGLTLLVIDAKGPSVGGVNEAYNLDGMSTGTNGLLILGNGYDGSPAGGPWAGYKATATTAYDPSGVAPWSGMGNDDLDPNGGLVFLLVRGWNGLTNAPANNLGDVDVNNNFVLDWTETPVPAGGQAIVPWTEVVDSIGYYDRGESIPSVSASTPFYTASMLNNSSGPAAFNPDSIARRLNNTTPNDKTAWYGGQIAGNTLDSIIYNTFFGGFKGQVTPGQPNLNSAPAPGNFLINEVSLNPPGTDDANYEYIEIINAAGGAANLQGLSLLLIGSNDREAGAQLGVIREAWDLGPLSTGPNGLLLLGNGYNEGRSPWGNYLDPDTQLGDPTDPGTPLGRYSSMGDDDIGYSDGFTLLLVRGYTGFVDQDLDTNNDGVLDITPWTSIVDSIGFDQTENATTGKTYAQGKITATPAYDYDNMSRKAANAAANDAAAWYGGDYGGNSATSIAFRADVDRPVFGGFRGQATPGRANLAAASETVTSIRINEVQVAPVPSANASAEYVELIDTGLGVTTLQGLTLVIADGRTGADNGKIIESIDLSLLSTGANGLLLLGDSYDNVTPYDAPNRLISPLTNREDPPGLDAGDIAPDAAPLILLVKGAQPAVSSNISALAAADIVDSIGFGASTNAAVTLVSPGFTPQNLSRYPGQLTPNTAAEWYGGQLDSTDATSVTYGASYFGNFKGGASPGRYNHAAPPSPVAASLVINEINVNPPGADGNAEFIEFRATTDTAFSTNGYTLLQLDSSGANTGSIYRAWSLDGLATGSNGLLLAGAGYATATPWTGDNAPAPETFLGTPATLGAGDIAGDSNNGATTFLLVRYFAGRVGQDLDDAVPPSNTGADDGILDPQPWSTLVDAVAFRSWDDGALPPALTGRVYGGVDLGQTNYTPDTLARKGDDLTFLSAGAWYGGDIADTAGATSTGYDTAQRFPAGFEGVVTPGRHNVGYTGGGGGDEPTLTIVPSGAGNVTVTWTGGTLETSTTLQPEWTAQPAATSPLTEPLSGVKFYRVRY